MLPPQNAPQAAIEELDEGALEVHQRCMDCLDDVVTTFMKLKDVEGIHEAARSVLDVLCTKYARTAH